MSVCGKTPEGGWHCAGTGCLHGICLHNAATPGIGLPRPVVLSEDDLYTVNADIRSALVARRG